MSVIKLFESMKDLKLIQQLEEEEEGLMEEPLDEDLGDIEDVSEEEWEEPLEEEEFEEELLEKEEETT